MKIKFSKITIDNFLSLGHAEVNLENRGYTLIEGINNDPRDGAKSNGSGKSTIFSAICYALTGETIQGLTSNLNNIITGGDMSVNLEFSVDSDNFTLIRSRDSKGHSDLKIYVNGVDKSGKGIRESQEVLNTLLPEITSDLIGEVIIVGQGMPHKFSNNTPSGRKDLLERLSHSDYMLDDIRERVEKRGKEISDKRTNITLERTKRESNKTYIEAEIQKKELELNNYLVKPDFEKQINDLRTLISLNTAKLQKLNKELSSKSLLMEQINQDILDLNQERARLIEEETKVFNQHNSGVKTEIATKKAEAEALKREIVKLQSIKDVCPTCGQKLPHVHKVDTQEQEKKVSLLEESLKTLCEKDTNQEKAYALNVEDIKQSFKERESCLILKKSKQKVDVDKLDADIKTLNEEITSDKIKLNKLLLENESFDRQKANCTKELESLKTSLTSVNSDILYYIKEEEEVGKHQEVISKMSTLIKRDFRGILLSSIISYIDQKCKIYAKEIFGTDNLEFKLDGNNINITYLNKPLEALSGGEQQKVDLILQFAIRAMMQEYTGFTSNIIVLDEILDNLDTTGCDAVLNFITNKLSDIESIFIISHHADSLNIGNDSTITVIKNKDGVSYIA